MRFSSKNVFSVPPTKKFLGFMIMKRDIEVNPDKIKAILEIKNPTSKKEV